jgi:hypothetical protein
MKCETETSAKQTDNITNQRLYVTVNSDNHQIA